MAAKSPFSAWFIEQHGKRPSNKTRDQLATLELHARWAANEAENLLARCDDYDNRMQSALYAWSAQERRHSGKA